MTIDIGPNLLAFLTLLLPTIAACAAAWFARQASVQSSKTNGHVALLMQKEGIRTKAENDVADALTSQNKLE